MTTKRRAILQFILGFSISGAATALTIVANLPGLWGTVLQELGRGAIAMTFGGVAASLGLVVVEEVFLFENVHLTIWRLLLLTIPQIALGLLWGRYRWKGGLAAIGEHLAWNQWFSSPLWLIPTLGMAAIYFILLFHKEPL